MPVGAWARRCDPSAIVRRASERNADWPSRTRSNGQGIEAGPAASDSGSCIASIAGVRFSRTELFQLLVAILALSAALTLANVSASRGLFSAGQLGLVIGLWFVSALVAVSTGVGLHEISHKIVAQRFGLWAEFRY